MQTCMHINYTVSKCIININIFNPHKVYLNTRITPIFIDKKLRPSDTIEMLKDERSVVDLGGTEMEPPTWKGVSDGQETQLWARRSLLQGKEMTCGESRV